MGRHGFKLSESQTLKIKKLAEANYSLEKIAEVLRSTYEIKVSIPTLSKYIKRMGVERLDNRCKKSTSRFSLNEKQEDYVRILYTEQGLSIREICENLEIMRGVKVSPKTLSKYLKDKGEGKAEPILKMDNDFNFGDEMDENTSNGTVYNEALLDKIIKDENLKRFYNYLNGDDYNVLGENGTIDTWFTRDGFPKIELSYSMVVYTKGDYDAVGGKFRTQYQYDSDKEFYTLNRGEKNGGNALKYRLELKEWYANNIGEIRRLYDEIIKRNFAREIKEVKLFNALCKELYEKKLGYGDIINGRNSSIQKTLRGESDVKQTYFLK